MSTTYFCKFFNCQLQNLPVDQKGVCNASVEIKCYNKKISLPKKKKTINPEWPEFEQKFKLNIKKGSSMRDRNILITIFHSSGLSKTKIGFVQVDLHTCATGAILHRLKIQSETAERGAKLGTISFSLRMKEKKNVNVEFKNIKLLDLTVSNEKPKYFLSISSIADSRKKVETETQKTINPIWVKCPQLKYESVGQKRLKAEILYISLYQKKTIGRDMVGTALLEFKTYLRAKFSSPVLVNLDMKDTITGEVIAKVELELNFLNFPTLGQMVNGEHTNYSCCGDTLFDDSEVPDIPQGEHFDQPKGIQTFICIDLGTTHSGYAYCTSDINEIDKVNIHMAWGEGHFRYKNKSAILYERMKPLSWGFKAITQYNSKRKAKKKLNESDSDFTLISDFKLNIHKNESVRQNGRTYPIGKICSDFLTLVKNDIINELTKQNYVTERSACKWILTVPAIWNDNDKSIMRKAAVNSGILTKDIDDETHFCFALEPESASLPCLLYNRATIKPRTKFLVLDAGGGTIDIAVYETVKPPDGTKFGIKQLQNASGGASGGKFINDRFLLFLQQNISVSEYNKLINSYDFTELMTKWEEAKLQFNKDQIEDDIFISLPNSINQIMKNIKTLSDYYEEDEGDLVIPGELFYEIYRAPIERTVEYVKAELDKIKGVEYIFMVGGFSESPILFDAIKNNFEKGGIKVIKTPQPGIRVLQGACWYGKYPKIISSRCSSLTYIAVIPESVNPETTLNFTKSGKKTNEQFRVMTRAGDIVETGTKHKLEVELKGSHGVIDVYATSLPRIKFLGPPECQKLLSINLKFRKKIKKTRLDVFIIFGESELKFEVFNPKTGKKVAANEFKVKYEEPVVDKKKEEEAMRKMLSFNNRAKFKPKGIKRQRPSKRPVDFHARASRGRGRGRNAPSIPNRRSSGRGRAIRGRGMGRGRGRGRGDRKFYPPALPSTRGRK